MHIESFIGRCQIDEINYWVQGYQDFPIFLHNLTVVGPETPITTSARCAPQTHKKVERRRPCCTPTGPSLPPSGRSLGSRRPCSSPEHEPAYYAWDRKSLARKGDKRKSGTALCGTMHNFLLGSIRNNRVAVKVPPGAERLPLALS
jgi:hypothetical protein